MGYYAYMSEFSCINHFVIEKNANVLTTVEDLIYWTRAVSRD